MIEIEKIVKHAERLGAERTEVIISKTNTNGCFIESNEVTNILTGVSEGYGIRVIKDNKIGFASGNDFSNIDKVIKRAILLSRYGKGVPSNFEFPSSNKKTKVKKIFDEEIALADISNITNLANAFIKMMEDVIIPFGRIRFTTIEYNIANSDGLNISEEGTFIILYASALKSKTEYEIFEKSRMLNALNLDEICSHTKFHLERSINAKIAKTQRLPVIFSPKVLAELLVTTFGQTLCGESVLLKNSPFSEKLEKRIASEKFSLIDDGTLPNGIGSFGVDQEGSPTKKTVLINKGILKNFLYDAKTASIAGKKSTGNGRRGYQFSDELYSIAPFSQATNLVVESGKRSIDEIIDDTKRGLFVEKVSWPRASAHSGIFSLELRTAYMIRDGELAEPVRWGSVNGNLYEAINKIDEIASKQEQRAAYPSGFGEGVLVPHIKFKSFDIVSKPF